MGWQEIRPRNEKSIITLKNLGLFSNLSTVRWHFANEVDHDFNHAIVLNTYNYIISNIKKYHICTGTYIYIGTYMHGPDHVYSQLWLESALR